MAWCGPHEKKMDIETKTDNKQFYLGVNGGGGKWHTKNVFKSLSAIGRSN